jgi:hypothetical protein
MSGSVDGLALGKEGLMKSPEKILAGPPRWRVRGKEEFTADELARLQEKLEGWLQQTMPKVAGKRSRHQFVMKPRHTGGA